MKRFVLSLCLLSGLAAAPSFSPAAEPAVAHDISHIALTLDITSYDCSSRPSLLEDFENDPSTLLPQMDKTLPKQVLVHNKTIVNTANPVDQSTRIGNQELTLTVQNMKASDEGLSATINVSLHPAAEGQPASAPADTASIGTNMRLSYGTRTLLGAQESGNNLLVITAKAQ